jgi:hypothetical protein
MWTRQQLTKVTLPAGKYYIGDPCYAFSSDLYKKIWGEQFNYSNGYYTNGTSHFVVHGTAYGDGVFKASNQTVFFVDSGSICIASADIVTENEAVYEFKVPVQVFMKNGLFQFNDLEIDTGDNELED